jgi:hypothetical protein
MLAVATRTVAAAKVDTCYPVQQTYGTGWTDQTSKHDGTMCWNSGTPKRAWCYLNVGSHPNIDSATLHYYQTSDTTNATVRFLWCNVNPINASPGPLHSALVSGMQLGSQSGGTGWHHARLTDAQWTSKPEDYMCISFVTLETPPPIPVAGAADGWGTANEPFLEWFYK